MNSPPNPNSELGSKKESQPCDQNSVTLEASSPHKQKASKLGVNVASSDCLCKSEMAIRKYMMDNHLQWYHSMSAFCKQLFCALLAIGADKVMVASFLAAILALDLYLAQKRQYQLKALFV